MSGAKKVSLAAAWLSGFLAWGAIGHSTRLLWGTSLTFGCYEFSMPVSAVLAVVLAAGSLLLAVRIKRRERKLLEADFHGL